MATVIEELLVSLGYELDESSEKDLKNFQNQVDDAAKSLVKLTAVAVGAAAAVVTFVAAVSAGTDQLGKDAEIIDIMVEDLDALHFAAEIATGSAGGLSGMMKTLSRNVGEATRGIGSGIEAFGILGIQFANVEGGARPTLEVLMDVADAIKGIDDTSRQLELAEKLGLGSLILLLRQGSSGIRDLVDQGKQLALVTKEDATRAAEFNDAVTRGLGRVLKGVGVFIASELSPAIKELVDELTEWFTANQKLLRQEVVPALRTVGRAVVFIGVTIFKLIKGLLLLSKAVGGLNNALRITLAIFGLLTAYQVGNLVLGLVGLIDMLATAIVAAGVKGTLAMAAPMANALLLGVVLVLIVGLIDEIVTMIQGGQTIIGDFFKILFEKFPELEALLGPIATNINFIIDLVAEFINLLTDPLNPDAWRTFFDNVKKLAIQFSNDLTEAVIKATEAMVSGVVKLLNTIPGVDIDASGISSALKVPEGFNFAGAAADLFDGSFSRGLAGPALSAATGLLDVAVPGVSNLVNQNFSVTVNSNGEGDLETKVMRAVNEAATQARRNMETTIDR